MGKQSSHAGAGLAIGTGIGAALGIAIFGAEGGTTWLFFAGGGTALGLLFGAALDGRWKEN